MASLLGTASVASIRARFTPILPILLFTTPKTQKYISIASRPTRPHPRTCSSTKSANMSAQPFLDTMLARRSIYQLDKTLPISEARVQEIVKHAILHVPSSFNSQSTRVLILFKDEHDKFWSTATDILKAIVPEDAFPGTKKRMDGFVAGAATILFFDDRKPIQEFQEKYSAYADRFPGWASESNGMHQYAIWTALEAEGCGANLQHYNPLVDAKVQEFYGVSDTWELKAQLVIGGRKGEAGEKTFKQVEGERLIVKGL